MLGASLGYSFIGDPFKANNRGLRLEDSPL